MAADDEDAREGLLLGDGTGDGDDDEDGNRLSTHAPLLKACLSARAELIGRGDWYGNGGIGNDDNTELLRESDVVWSDFDDSLTRWKGSFQALLAMRGGGVSDGTPDESSDRAYSLREDFRESNMLLGIDSMSVRDFFASHLEKNRRPEAGASSSSSPAADADPLLARICRSYLRFAEGTFRTALGLVLEQERCCQKAGSSASSYPSGDSDVASLWERGQHFLLRGRAHHNIGLAAYELARHCEDNAPPGGGRRPPGSPGPEDALLTRARDEFDNAMSRARSLRRNTVLIHGHPDAKDASTQNSFSWAAEATLHSLEAVKLECHASVLHISCWWKLGRTKEAEERFDCFFGSFEPVDVLKYAGAKGTSRLEAAEALDDMYWLAMTVAELSTRSLEHLPSKRGWNARAGEELLRIARKATTRAASISDLLLSFADLHSLDYAREHVATRAAIEREESDICKWWEETKARARRKLSDVVRGARAADDAMLALPRSEVAGEVRATPRAAQLPRRIFVQDDGRRLQTRSSLSGRTSRANKSNSSENKAVADRFGSEFGSGNNVANGPSASETGRDNATKYCKWGNEVLEDHKRCCPPLPEGLSLHHVRALEKRLGDILPTN